MKPQKRRTILLAGIPIIVIAFLAWWFLLRDSGPPVEEAGYSETFDEAGTWPVGDDGTATGTIRDGVYEMFVELSGDIFWVTGGRNFANAVYEVAATPVEGTIDNGYGLLFRVDNEENAFYIFKVSSDGYVYIGRCINSCTELTALVDRDWFASDAVQQGLNITNILRVEADGSDMIFYVNDAEVGRATDEELTQGDIGLVAETFSPGGLRVQFDNFSVMPLNDD
jgi:hypothetical protein